jgi:hypothetical protein
MILLMEEGGGMPQISDDDYYHLNQSVEAVLTRVRDGVCSVGEGRSDLSATPHGMAQRRCTRGLAPDDHDHGEVEALWMTPHDQARFTQLLITDFVDGCDSRNRFISS